MEIEDIGQIGKQVSLFWAQQNIVSPPNTLDDLLHFEFSKSIKLPDDFRQLFMMTNGMVSLYPNYFDKEGFLFYPLEELTIIDEELNMPCAIDADHCLIFAEFMHKSWWYGVKFSKFSDEYEIGLVCSADRFKVITRNLAEFLQLYMQDASILYDVD